MSQTVLHLFSAAFWRKAQGCRIVIFFVVLFAWGCSSTDTAATGTVSDSVSVNRVQQKNEESGTAAASLRREQLIGSWTDGFTENSVFTIRQDSIYYTEHLEAYAYQLEGDSITIHFPDLTYRGFIAMENDTLLLRDAESGTNHFYRFTGNQQDE